MNENDHSTTAGRPASIDGSDTDADPIVMIGVRIGIWSEIRTTMDREAMASRAANNLAAARRYVIREENADDIVDVLREELSVRMATTLDGAAIQLREAIARADSLLDSIEEGAKNYWVDRHGRAVSRLLNSVLQVVEAASERSIAVNVHPEFARLPVDPWNFDTISRSEDAR